MRPRFIKTELAEYEPAEWTPSSEPPVRPINDNVLVLADVCVSTRKGVLLPEKHVEQMNRAAESGVIIDLGDDAFRWNANQTRAFVGERPAPGTRVCFSRYSGQMIHRDGRVFFLMTDTCIGAIEL